MQTECENRMKLTRTRILSLGHRTKQGRAEQIKTHRQ